MRSLRVRWLVGLAAGQLTAMGLVQDVAGNNFPNLPLRIWARCVVASRLFGSPNRAPCA
jgi:hypothetical protein